ncbi:MAG: DUF4190 domain-containing protein [Eubacteriaceae bacterium]
MEKYSGKATASLVLGIISVVLFWLGWFAILSFICGLIGILLSSQVKKAGQIEDFTPNGITTAGFVLSIIGLVLSASSLIICVLCAGALGVAGTL